MISNQGGNKTKHFDFEFHFFIRIPFKIPFKFKGNSLQIQGPLFASHPQIEGPRFESFSTVIDGQAIVTHKKSGSDSFPFNSGF
jgi:hypothetical protein